MLTTYPTQATFGSTTLYWIGETPLVRLLGSDHCGILPANRFKYEVWLSGEKLNDRGFLTDNAVIGAWFDNLKETSWSCELICREAAMAFLAAESSVKAAKVRVWGIRDQAYAEIELRQL
jgi:hypothetical protein